LPIARLLFRLWSRWGSRKHPIPPTDGSPKSVLFPSGNPRGFRPCCRAARGCPLHPNLEGRAAAEGGDAGVSRQPRPGLVGGNSPSAKQRRPKMQNIVILAGNIGQTPETRTSQGGIRI